MGKWMWRFSADNDQLWVRVIKARHGDIRWDEEGFGTAGRNHTAHGWWKNVLGLSRGENGGWFRENLEVRPGERNSIRFWYHNWIGERPLKITFSRLYHLCNNKEGSISSMGDWVDGEWSWDFRWNRPILEREQEQVQALRAAIEHFRPTVGAKDGWRWKLTKSGSYSVKSAYNAIFNQASTSPVQREDRLWAKLWKAPRST